MGDFFALASATHLNHLGGETAPPSGCLGSKPIFPGVGPYRPGFCAFCRKTLSKLEELHQHWFSYFRTNAIKQLSSAFALTLTLLMIQPLLIPTGKALASTTGSVAVNQALPPPSASLSCIWKLVSRILRSNPLPFLVGWENRNWVFVGWKEVYTCGIGNPPSQ